jgi:flagellar hook assembly protein FlgD
LYDLAGRLVKSLLAEAPLEAGRHNVTWDGTDDRGRAVAAGVYLYRLQAGTFSESKAVALVK